MARPSKQGVDYFPLDVHMDDKVKFIEIKYGLEGYGILIKLFQKIYSCGYWYEWGEDQALLFSDEIRTELEKVNNVVDECIKRGIFDSRLYSEHSILTSKGIQERYKLIVRRRKEVMVKEEYLLIDSIKEVNVDNNKVNDDTTKTIRQHDGGKSTQSKVKESKGKKKDNIYTPEFEKFWVTYPRKIGKKASFVKWNQRLSDKENPLDPSYLIECAKNYADYTKNDGTREKHIMHPETFLGPNERYADYESPDRRYEEPIGYEVDNLKVLEMDVLRWGERCKTS